MNNVKLSTDDIEALHYATLDDSTKIIRYFEEKELKQKRKWWKKGIISLFFWVFGIFTSLLVQYLTKLLKLN